MFWKAWETWLTLWSIFKNSRLITEQTHPKTKTWHFADPLSLAPGRGRERGRRGERMTAALDLTSNADETVRKGEREGEKKVTSPPWQLARRASQNAEQFLPPALHPRLSILTPTPPHLCVSLIKTCCRLGSLRATRFGMRRENTQRTQRARMPGLKRWGNNGVIVAPVQIDRPSRLQWLLASFLFSLAPDSHIDISRPFLIIAWEGERAFMALLWRGRRGVGERVKSVGDIEWKKKGEKPRWSQMIHY